MAPPIHAEWRALGLRARETAKLRVHAGFLYACTTDGLYRLRTDSPDTLWSAIGFAGQSVLDFAVLDSQTFLACKALTAPSDTVSLFRSTDAGGSWHPFQNGFGAGASRQARLLLATDTPDTVFAASSRIEKSDDGGMSWRIVKQAQVLNALEGSPADPLRFWAGGETVIFAPYVLTSTDGGETWEQIDLVASGDNAVDAIAGHPTDPDVVYLGMEGRVMKTENGGESWVTLTAPDPSLYTFGLAIRRTLPLTLFAAGASNLPDPRGVVFYQSLDDGQSWQATTYSADAGYGVRHLVLSTGAAEETVYVATYNGVYRYSQATVDVPPPEPRAALALSCRPNPFGRTAVLEFNLPRVEAVFLAVLDAAGRRVAVLHHGLLEAGPHRFEFDAKRWKAGIYFARLAVGNRTAIARLLHLE